MSAAGAGLSESGRAAVAAAAPSRNVALPQQSAAFVPVTGHNGTIRLDAPRRQPSVSNASTVSYGSNNGDGSAPPPAASAAAAAPPPAGAGAAAGSPAAAANTYPPFKRTPNLDANLESIKSRFSTLTTLTETALEELRRSGARKVEVAIEKDEYRVKCPQLTGPVEVIIAFIRHSESCANVLKRNVPLGGLRQKSYTDPELSERGIQMAQERSETIVENLLTPADITAPNDPWIIGSSTLFRAQQTAMYLSEGIRSNRASDRIVVMPYIQETGIGEENVALDDSKRLELGLYKKLPGSAERLLTSLFRVAENPTKPNVNSFFNWLGCNLELIYRAGTANPAAAVPPKMRLLIVTHCNLMNEIYKKLRRPNQPSSMKYDNLEAMVVNVKYAPNTPWRANITNDKVAYRPSLRIKASCPDNVCRFKEDICPKGAKTVPLGERGGDEMISPYVDICTKLSSITGPVDYTQVIRPIVDRLKSDTRPQVVSARKRLEAYKPSFFSRSNNVTIRGDDINTIIQSLECASLSLVSKGKLGGNTSVAAAPSSSALVAASAGNLAFYEGNGSTNEGNTSTAARTAAVLAHAAGVVQASRSMPSGRRPYAHNLYHNGPNSLAAALARPLEGASPTMGGGARKRRTTRHRTATHKRSRTTRKQRR